jgi:hypothetical protein
MIGVRIIKKSELQWGGDTDTAVVDKPLAVLDVEHFLLTAAEAEKCAQKGVDILRGQRFNTAVDWFRAGIRKSNYAEYAHLDPQSDLGLTQHVFDKWAKFRERHSTYNDSLQPYILKSRPETVDPILRHALSYLFRARWWEPVTRRSVWLGKHTHLNFLIIDNVIVEFVTHRGLRQLNKLIAHHIQDWKLNQPSEQERINDIL